MDALSACWHYWPARPCLFVYFSFQGFNGGFGGLTQLSIFDPTPNAREKFVYYIRRKTISVLRSPFTPRAGIIADPSLHRSLGVYSNIDGYEMETKLA